MKLGLMMMLAVETVVVVLVMAIIVRRCPLKRIQHQQQHQQHQQHSESPHWPPKCPEEDEEGGGRIKKKNKQRRRGKMDTRKITLEELSVCLSVSLPPSLPSLPGGQYPHLITSHLI